jgi:hypothetical protein
MDAVQRLEHDHQHLNRIVESLRNSLQESLRGERDVNEVAEELEEFLRLVNEELFAHFEREESVLFPWVIEHFPDTRDAIASMESAHDRICGAASRLDYLSGQGRAAVAQSFDTAVALFARFDANFIKHATEEHEFIRALDQRLTAEQREQVAQMLDEL